MEYDRNDIYLCEHCGQFFSNETDELVEVPYWDMPASLALTVMSTRKKQFQFCHLQKCLRISRLKKKGTGKTGS